MDVCMVRYGYMDPQEWGNDVPEFVIDNPLEILGIVDGLVSPSDEVAEKESLR